MSSPAMADDFGEATAELADSLGVKTAAVDVSEEEMVRVAKRFNVAQVPTVLGFGGASKANPYTKKVDREIVYFNPLATGTFSKTAFKRWVSGKVVPSDAVTRVEAGGALSKLGAPVASQGHKRALPLAPSQL